MIFLHLVVAVVVVVVVVVLSKTKRKPIDIVVCFFPREARKEKLRLFSEIKRIEYFVPPHAF